MQCVVQLQKNRAMVTPRPGVWHLQQITLMPKDLADIDLLSGPLRDEQEVNS